MIITIITISNYSWPLWIKYITDVIASQLDISKDDIIKTLKSSQLDQQNKEKSIIKISPSPKQEMMNWISGFGIENFILEIQKRI